VRRCGPGGSIRTTAKGATNSAATVVAFTVLSSRYAGVWVSRAPRTREETEAEVFDDQEEDMTAAVPESRQVAAALALPRALEQGVCGDDLRDLYAPTVVSVEHPNPISPRGSTADLEHIVAASTAGAALLASQRYAIRDVHESGDLVIFRYTWTGVIAADRGPFRAGQEITAHVAAFATITDGRISGFETFDCYEPFGGTD